MLFESLAGEESDDMKSSQRNLIMHNDVEYQANWILWAGKTWNTLLWHQRNSVWKCWNPSDNQQKMMENLIIMTLPTEYNYVNEFHPPSERNGDLWEFWKKLVELITGQASEFICAQRKPTENVLSYSQRLRNLLLYSSGVLEKNLENDLWSIRMVYQ